MPLLFQNIIHPRAHIAASVHPFFFLSLKRILLPESSSRRYVQRSWLHHYSGSGDRITLSSALGRAKNHTAPNPDHMTGAGLLRLDAVRANLASGTRHSDGNIENFYVSVFIDSFLKISIISILCFIYRHPVKTPKVNIVFMEYVDKGLTNKILFWKLFAEFSGLDRALKRPGHIFKNAPNIPEFFGGSSAIFL